MKKNGFTLIELLVVISIISILSVVGFVAYQNVTSKAKDAKMKADIDAIKKAYETNYVPEGQGRYQPLADSQFASGKIPTQPNGTPYTCTVGPNCTVNSSQNYQVSAILSNGTFYTAVSTQGTYTQQQTSPGTNLITNSSFEDNTNGWTLSSGGSQNNDTAVFGRYSLKQDGSGSNYMSLDVMTSGVAYTLSYYVKRINVAGGSGSGMQINSNRNWTAKWIQGTNDWQRETITFTSAGTNAVIYAQNNGSTGTTYYDGIRLEQGSEATPY